MDLGLFFWELYTNFHGMNSKNICMTHDLRISTICSLLFYNIDYSVKLGDKLISWGMVLTVTNDFFLYSFTTITSYGCLDLMNTILV